MITQTAREAYREMGRAQWPGRRPMRQLVFLFPGSKPFRTPGTRLDWCNLAEWLIGWEDVSRRSCRHAGPTIQRAHLDLLVTNRALIEAETSLELLLDLQSVLTDRDVRPLRGCRAGHPTTPLLNWCNNRIRVVQSRACPSNSIRNA